MKMRAAILTTCAAPQPFAKSKPLQVQEVDLDPKPAMEHFGFAFRRLEEGLRDYLT